MTDRIYAYLADLTFDEIKWLLFQFALLFIFIVKLVKFVRVSLEDDTKKETDEKKEDDREKPCNKGETLDAAQEDEQTSLAQRLSGHQPNPVLNGHGAAEPVGSAPAPGHAGEPPKP